MSDPYAPQPHQPNQPYSGQPYYPQQQGGAQPNPYADPFAAQPGADPYGQPQQGYQQPAYGQQAPTGYPSQPPVGYPPQPPVKKRRTGLIVSLVVAVFALVACSGIVALVLKFGSDDKTGSSGATSTGAKVTLQAPATIGTLKKSSDQSSAKAMSSQLTKAGLDNPFAAVYQDTKNAAHRVIIWGGTGEIFNAGGAQTQLNSFFSSAGSQLGGAKPEAVDAGSVGGKAECAKSGLSGAKISICAWVGTDALLGFIFNAVEPDAAAAQMRAILPSIVVKG
ncbi:hypothetical protein ODJ79_34920 [Actinoplanes sp. KI2]|uniref:hypothetical protein n=1 Tax=Actinoplanes sp. KI2 TaxID=2983315 RepID=UPI0021D58E4A|nr:hypothetical protein [Actinoplanes sp. KI2]MCU7728934.1 hypothetical protein [Actinoplanes sp. KI2]